MADAQQTACPIANPITGRKFQTSHRNEGAARQFERERDEQIGEHEMHKPRELTPRPRNFFPAGMRKKPGTAKPEVLPTDDNQEDTQERPVADRHNAK